MALRNAAGQPSASEGLFRNRWVILLFSVISIQRAQHRLGRRVHHRGNIRYLRGANRFLHSAADACAAWWRAASVRGSAASHAGRPGGCRGLRHPHTSRRFDEAGNRLSGLRDGRVYYRAFLRSKGSQHIVGRVQTPWGSADADPQAAEGAGAQARHHVAQSVVPAMSAAISLADFAQRQVEIIMNDQQASRRGPPALDRLQYDLAAIVHEAGWQNETRTAHRERDQPRRRAQTQSGEGIAHCSCTQIVSGPLILPLGIAQTDDDPGGRVARRQAVRSHRQKLAE
jgi:hypothetical protein